MKNVIKKNQLAILVIALMLVTAGYLNYTSINNENYIETSANVNANETLEGTFDNTILDDDKTNIVDNVILDTAINEDYVEESDNIAVQTNAKTLDDDYFVNSKLQRDTMYSQMIESYQKILESSTISTEQKAIASQEINNINNTKNAIMICENLIQTKGLSESVIFVNDQSISIIIKAEELSQEQIAQVQNIVAREMKAEIENIHISNKV